MGSDWNLATSQCCLQDQLGFTHYAQALFPGLTPGPTELMEWGAPRTSGLALSTAAYSQSHLPGELVYRTLLTLPFITLTTSNSLNQGIPVITPQTSILCGDQVLGRDSYR